MEGIIVKLVSNNSFERIFNFFLNFSFIFALTGRGSFLIICPYTLSLIHHHEVSWRDFELMQDEENNLLVLTNGSPSMLQLINISGNFLNAIISDIISLLRKLFQL